MKVSYAQVPNAKKLNLVIMIREMTRQVKKALYPLLRGKAAEYCTRYITGRAVLRETSMRIYRNEGQAYKVKFLHGVLNKTGPKMEKAREKKRGSYGLGSNQSKY